MASLLCKCGHSEAQHIGGCNCTAEFLLEDLDAAPCMCTSYRPNNSLAMQASAPDAQQVRRLCDEAAERRRYALLQAATTLLGAPNSDGEQWTIDGAALIAIELLAEIERREKEPR